MGPGWAVLPGPRVCTDWVSAPWTMPGSKDLGNTGGSPGSGSTLTQSVLPTQELSMLPARPPVLEKQGKRLTS